MWFFSFNSSICHALLLNYSVWIGIRIQIRIFFGFGFRSGKSFGFFLIRIRNTAGYATLDYTKEDRKKRRQDYNSSHEQLPMITNDLLFVKIWCSRLRKCRSAALLAGHSQYDIEYQIVSLTGVRLLTDAMDGRSQPDGFPISSLNP
jgi:hypothetical protein